MFEKIVVPLDGSVSAEQVVPYAAGLATALGAALELLHAVDPSTIDEPTPADARQGVYMDQLVEQRESWAGLYLGDVAAPFISEGLRVETKVAAGPPAQAIIDSGRPDGQDLVAMATHGRTGIGRRVMGSVAEKVLHQGTTPLLLFRPAGGTAAPGRPPRTIVVPLDGSDLAERALPVARFIAQQLRARVLLIRVIPTRELAGPVLMKVGADTYRMTPREEAGAKAYLDEQRHALCADRIDVDPLLTSGDAADELIKIAAGVPDSLVVMSTHGRSGLSLMVLGSVADRVVCESGVPVLLVRAVH